MKYNHDPRSRPSIRHDGTRFNDRFEPFDSRGGEGRIERLIRISREPIFYAKFSTRRFHRSRADNRLKYSERARE